MTPRIENFDPERDLVLERVVDVPPELVWAAWTKPEHVVKWFTPAPYVTTACEIDLRPGGIFATTMRSPDGEESSSAGCYLEVVQNERLVFTDALLPGFRPSQAAFFTAAILLEREGDGTRYIAHAMHTDPAARAQHEEMGFLDGWGKALEQLVEMTAELAPLSLILTRRFAAPISLVFEALSDPKHMKHWCAPEGCSVADCTLDPRPGGRWRLGMNWPDGSLHRQGGVVELVEPGRRIVYTFAWEDESGAPEHESVVSMTLRELDGQTELRFHQAFFESASSRDSHSEGWASTLDGLARHLEKLHA